MKLIPKTIRDKVFLFIGGIAVISGLATGFYTYKEEVEKAKKSSIEKIRLTLSFLKSTRSYVRKTLRPKIYEVLNKYRGCIREDFILEAQSSSFVTANIFKRVSEDFQGLKLRQVAFRPLNPMNNPTPIEAKIIDYFRKTKAKEYYEPYEATLLQAKLEGLIKGGAVFGVNILIMFVIFYILERYVFKPIEVLKEHADKISKGDVEDKIPIKGEDEIGELAKAFERMRVSIKKVMDILK